MTIQSPEIDRLTPEQYDRLNDAVDEDFPRTSVGEVALAIVNEYLRAWAARDARPDDPAWVKRSRCPECQCVNYFHDDGCSRMAARPGATA